MSVDQRYPLPTIFCAYVTDKVMQVVLHYIRKQFDPESHNER